MNEAGFPADRLRVTTCDTEKTLAAASALFDQYRQHYGQTPDAGGVVVGWLTEMVRSRMLTVYAASVGPLGVAPAVGLATSHEVPASLAMRRSWQLRDLYVLPMARRQGAALALVSAVRAAALAAGATRVSLVTESDNHTALSLYRSLGFRPVEGLVSLSLDLAQDEITG